MNSAFNRIRVWAEQGNVTIPQLFFQFYKQLSITDEEAMLLMHVLAFHSEGNDFPTPAHIEARTSFSQNTISAMLHRLMQKGMLELKQDVDASGKLCEKFSLYPLWERILDKMQQSLIVQEEKQEKLDEKVIFTLFEQELGRLLTPIEIETVCSWFDKDHHSPDIIKAALREAVLAGKLSFKYIDRILLEWKKKNITTLQQVEQHTEQYRANTVAVAPKQSAQHTKPPVKFYNWLEERE